jgi:carbon-monoxide dehydrogenase large subunit
LIPPVYMATIEDVRQPPAIGAPLRRREDVRMVAGRAMFASDVRLPGLTHAAVLRSPHAHARIVSVDAAAARAARGVLMVLTFDDIADVARPIPQVMPHRSLESRTPYPLARGIARYVGEPVAMVVAEDPYLAEDALELIDVEFEPLDAVAVADAALLPTAPRVHDDVPGNVAGRFGQHVGDVDAALAGAHMVLTDRLTIGRVSAQPLETRAVTALYRPDAPAERLTVWCSAQSPHGNLRMLADQLGLPPEKIRVVAPDIGGGFGVKNRFYPEDTLVPLAAMRLGRPVQWIEGRGESFTATYQAREQAHQVTIGLARDGRILALHDDFVYDQGAYTPLGVVVPWVTSVSIPGPYRVPNYRVECTMALTNKTPSAPYRGAGKPQAAFVMERMLDLGADALGIDRVEIRRRNLLRSEEFPYDTGATDLDETSVVYDSGQYEACLERALELVGHESMADDRARAERRGLRAGIGTACYVEMTGRGPFEGARVIVAPDGKVRVCCGLSAQGQSHETMLAQICADSLGVPFDDVTVSLGDTATIPRSIGTYAARVTVMAGNAVAMAAQKVIDMAGTEEDGRSDGRPLEATCYFECSRPVYAAGTYSVVVEVDPDTGLVRVVRHALVHDCGVPVNPRVVEGQIQGALTQGLGAALLEEVHYDEAGQLLTASLKDYALPSSLDFPALLVDHVETPSPFNPLGVKGVGEGGTIPAAPAVAAAIEDALDGAVRVRRTPVHPPDVMALLQAAGS